MVREKICFMQDKTKIVRNKICFRRDKTNHPKRASSPSRTSHDGRLVTVLLLVIYYCAKDWGQQHLKRSVQNKDKQGVLDPDQGQNTKADLDAFFFKFLLSSGVSH